MNFNTIFNFISAISFTIDFKVSHDYYQDFFFFDGNNSKAHLYRQNNTLTLHLIQQNNFKIYQYSNLTGNFSFSWSNVTVNDVKMRLLKSNNDIETWNFTFIPSAFQINDVCSFEPLLQNVSNGTSFSYLYIIIIMIIVILMIKADIKFVRNFIDVIKAFLKIEAENKSLENISRNNSSIDEENGQRQ